MAACEKSFVVGRLPTDKIIDHGLKSPIYSIITPQAAVIDNRDETSWICHILKCFIEKLPVSASALLAIADS